MEKPERVYDI